jgi:DNA replication protein DnaC
MPSSSAIPRIGQTLLAHEYSAGKPAKTNHRVLFTNAMDMLNQLHASQADHSVVRKLRLYTEPSLLVCDELGYMALDQHTSNLFYQVISARHARRRAPSSPPTLRFPTGEISCTTRRLPPRSPTAWSKSSEVFLLGGDSLRKRRQQQQPAA